MAASSRPLADRIVECLGALDVEALAALYRADALLDVNAPRWRYQLPGRAAIAEQLREDRAGAGASARVAALRATPTADGVAVEVEVRFARDGEERRRRELHLFHTDGDAVALHVAYRTGTWDAATIARQAAEAPMVAP